MKTNSQTHTTKATVSDDTMELLAYLYDFMDETDKAAWSLSEAEALVEDQLFYEMANAHTTQTYDAQDVYEVIRQFIEQDAEDD